MVLPLEPPRTRRLAYLRPICILRRLALNERAAGRLPISRSSAACPNPSLSAGPRWTRSTSSPRRSSPARTRATVRGPRRRTLRAIDAAAARFARRRHRRRRRRRRRRHRDCCLAGGRSSGGRLARRRWGARSPALACRRSSPPAVIYRYGRFVYEGPVITEPVLGLEYLPGVLQGIREGRGAARAPPPMDGGSCASSFAALARAANPVRLLSCTVCSLLRPLSAAAFLQRPSRARSPTSRRCASCRRTARQCSRWLLL